MKNYRNADTATSLHALALGAPSSQPKLSLRAEHIRVVYELNGVHYPEGLELISLEGVRALCQQANSEQASAFERWIDDVALPALTGKSV